MFDILYIFTVIVGCGCFWFGYVMGWRKGYREAMQYYTVQQIQGDLDSDTH